MWLQRINLNYDVDSDDEWEDDDPTGEECRSDDEDVINNYI